MGMGSHPDVDVIGIIIEALVAAVGTTMFNLGVFEDHDDLPDVEDCGSVDEMVVEINAWVSRQLGRPVVILRPGFARLSTEHIGSAVGVLIFVVTNPPDDPL